MKKLFLCVSMLFCLGSYLYAECESSAPLIYKPLGGTHSGGAKSPVMPWYIDLTDNVITMDATPCNYTLNLYDEDGEVVYSAFVPAGTTMIVLPSTLSGSFELRFETDTYYYYGYIDL